MSPPASPLKIVFAGTPQFAVPALQFLLNSPHRVIAVYTQPDRPAGRGQRLAPSAVKVAAAGAAVPVEQPATLRDGQAAARLAAYAPDLMVVAAYGLILPPEILAIPRLGCLNIHASLLPRWRGAAPIQRAILAGDSETGICIMRMEAGLDTGPVLLERRIQIGADETGAQLHDRLSLLGAQALVAALPGWAARTLEARPQPLEGVSYAQKIRRSEGRIQWDRPARDIDRQIRAFNPWPIAHTQWRDEVVRIWRASPLDAQLAKAGVPGTVLSASAHGIIVAAGEGCVNITELQLAGRKTVQAGAFINAHAISGEVFT